MSESVSGENKMNEAAELMNRLSIMNGINGTSQAGVFVYKASEYQPRQPLCYEQGIIIVGQGSKRVYLGGREYEYNPENYLVLTVPLPAECEVFATEAKPLLALFISIDMGILNRIIRKMDEQIDHIFLDPPQKSHGLFLARSVPEIKNTVLRLLRVLQSPIESRILGDGLMYELIFRIMCGENASALYALSMKNTNLAKIDKALKQIHDNYSEPIDVDSLARVVHMSASAFHRAFKDVTSSSPIQYLKKVRLNNAKNMLLERRMRVNEAATVVGYESPSQFSREFKRYFGYSPVMATKNLAKKEHKTTG
jgi:AraC-like DNA-binding protein